eukprot:TRINITY_DN16181_c0_g1_i4.p3 TRINITY_DN16181_c0_g1~~TRINITY_DN16181_c0_g1_i4.p3  ORF type:complete len:110 (+),score=10.37 TRINITY_DN16181_c0_g1_i4:90-419(+)
MCIRDRSTGMLIMSGLTAILIPMDGAFWWTFLVPFGVIGLRLVEITAIAALLLHETGTYPLSPEIWEQIGFVGGLTSTLKMWVPLVSFGPILFGFLCNWFKRPAKEKVM